MCPDAIVEAVPTAIVVLGVSALNHRMPLGNGEPAQEGGVAVFGVGMVKVASTV